MNIGLLVRADDRGLGVQSQEAYRHLPITKTLGIEMGCDQNGYPLTPYEQHWTRFPDAEIVTYDGRSVTPWETVERFLDGLDVVLTFETFYQDSFVAKARERGVKTVVVGNFEFQRWIAWPDLPRPDLFISPSTWHLADWPENTVHIPFPVARDRLPYVHRSEAKTFLHVAGHSAIGDRNGTLLFFQALRFVKTKINVIITTQAEQIAGWRQVPHHVDLEVRSSDTENYWDLYEEGDVLVAPRRYGGLSLPMGEALSRGMPVVSLDVEPQNRFLPKESLVKAYRERDLKCQVGPVERFMCRGADLGAKLDELARNPALVSSLSEQANETAQGLSWEVLGPRFVEVLSDLCRAAA